MLHTSEEELCEQKSCVSVCMLCDPTYPLKHVCTLKLTYYTYTSLFSLLLKVWVFWILQSFFASCLSLSPLFLLNSLLLHHYFCFLLFSFSDSYVFSFFLILTKLFVISLTFLLQFFLSYIILSTLCMSMGCRCQTRHDHYHYPRTRTVLIVNSIASKLHKHRTYTWRLRYIGWYVILVIVYNSQHTIVNRHTFFR